MVDACKMAQVYFAFALFLCNTFLPSGMQIVYGKVWVYGLSQ